MILSQIHDFFIIVFKNPIFTTFLILFTGLLIGKVKIGFFSLGTSGVFFSGFIAGICGVEFSQQITQIGLVLFMYAIGIQSGPGFFNIFGLKGLPYLLISFTTGAFAALLSYAAGYAAGFPPEITLGLYTGSLNHSSSLAILMDNGWSGGIASGYALTYPVGLITVIIFIQLLPKLFKKDINRALKEFDPDNSISGPTLQSENLIARKFLVENRSVHGKTLAEINLTRLGLNISRIKRKNKIIIPDADSKLMIDDVILAVGPEKALNKLKKFLGAETHENLESPEVEARQIVMTNESLHHTELDKLGIGPNYNAVITRVWRGPIELFPHKKLIIESGDTLLAVGKISELERLTRFLGTRRKINEIDFFSMAFTITIGVFIGSIAVPFGAMGKIKLGIVGGTLLCAMVLSYFRQIGMLTGQISQSAELVLKEIGVNFFLAGLGIQAGAGLVMMEITTVVKIFFSSALIMVLSMYLTFIISTRLFKFDFVKSAACLCGALNSSVAIIMLSSVFKSSKMMPYFAMCYPASLFGIIIFSQLLAALLVK